ncbi:hypothetical protein IGI04_022376 [Brassica rapa subsp. trilocularis]|uniref:Uncharacterized protein n=1 Tax=Brassica rapa subsp. trilocularis TaxID=1813537 RepID=A0ABQ7M361_BRACM|nr:hypothetical protein IGI04_022376 [Brassica rapa subsp. trilocularis]
MKIDVDAIEDDDVVESTASSSSSLSHYYNTCPLSCSSILALRSNTLFLQPQREQRWCLDDNMRPELPGFYFDEEKKKYFAIKGPIPGSKPASSSSKASEQKPESKPFKVSYLQCKKLESWQIVWRYVSTENIGDAALKEFQVDIQTSQGLTTKNILVAGSN